MTQTSLTDSLREKIVNSILDEMDTDGCVSAGSAADRILALPEIADAQEAVRMLTLGGWSVERVSMYDEEGVEGWRWTGPNGEEYEEISDHNEVPPLPEALTEQSPE
jgi:hypothetical protein